MRKKLRAGPFPESRSNPGLTLLGEQGVPSEIEVALALAASRTDHSEAAYSVKKVSIAALTANIISPWTDYHHPWLILDRNIHGLKHKAWASSPR